MSEPSDELPNRAVFIHAPPDIFFKDGLGHVVDISGERRLERVMAISTLLEYADRMAAFRVEWDARQMDGGDT